MKRLFLTLVLVVCTTTVVAIDEPTSNLGEKLFNDSSLGTTGNSCATCHPNGNKLEESKAYDDDMLKEMVNFCIRDAMKGEMMALDSLEIESFLIYLRSLEK